MYQDASPSQDVEALHRALYAGEIVRFGDLEAMRDLAAFARGFLEERLRPHDPTRIHEQLDRDTLAQTLAEVQRTFANAPETKLLWRALLEGVGLDPADTARDRLVVRFQPPWPPDGEPHRARSTGTVSFHRDTWGTNLYAQVNWWAPVYPITAGRTFAFLPELFARPLANSSADFDLQAVIERNRRAAASAERGEMVPRPLEAVDMDAALPVTIAPGEVIAFSAQHAHVGVPNHTGLTRISLETRTLRLSDHLAGRGAANVDGRARWMALGMFRRMSDGRLLTEALGVEALEPFAGPWPER